MHRVVQTLQQQLQDNTKYPLAAGCSPDILHILHDSLGHGMQRQKKSLMTAGGQDSSCRS